jgi:superfamily II DNA/RNA helicase
VYIRKVIPTNQKTQFRYLQFLIEDAAEDAAESAAGDITEDARPTPSRISFFFERKDIMRKCIKTLRHWLLTKCGYSWAQAVDTIVGYHATLAERDKTRIYAEFKRKGSKIRILCGTEAMSTGLNVLNILQVIQVGMVRDGNLNILLQRLGRGERKGQNILGIFFIEAQWVGERLERQTATRRSKAAHRKSVQFAADDRGEPLDSTDNEDNAEDPEVDFDSESSEKIRKSNCLNRIPDVLYEFCNTETEYLRNILLDHYQEPAHFRDGVILAGVVAFATQNLRCYPRCRPHHRKARGADRKVAKPGAL